MKKLWKQGKIFRRKENGLTAKEEAEASRIASSISAEIESGYPKEKIDEAEDKARKMYRKRRPLKALWDRIRVLFFIACHPEIWGPSVAVPASVAVLYLVLPLDAIPDILPSAGLLDDIFIITSMIGIIVKTVSSFPKEKLYEIRSRCPRDILLAFDSMFGTPEPTVEKDVQSVRADVVDEKEAKVERAVGNIERGLGAAQSFISSFHSALENAAGSNPSLRQSRLYRIVDRVDVYSGAVKNETKKVAMRALEDALRLMLLKKGVKSLLSFSLFLMALVFYSMKDEGAVFLVFSSLSMLISYGFFIISLIKTVPRIYHFGRSYITDGLEGGVVALLFRDSADNPGLREAVVRCGVRKIKNDSELQTLLIRSFGRTIIIFLVKLALIALSFFALKKVVLLQGGLKSSFQVIFAPFVELFNLFFSHR